eukprot:Skav215615  [mRNA]  locus=scaffold666:598931:609326:- [translate_table: standard]
MGRVSTIDGSYHLCRGHPESCTAAGQNDVTVHIGQWRLWKESELLAEAPEGYGRDAKNLLTQYFKRHDLEKGRGDESGLAWKPPGRQGVLNIGGGSKPKPAEPKKTEPAPAAEVTATKAARIKDLRQQLKELKASLKKDEEAGGTRKKRKEPPAEEKEDRERKKKKGKPFSGAGVTGAKDVDWGDGSPEGDDSPSDDSDEEEESEEEESSETAAKKARRKKKPAKKSRGKKKKGSKKKKGKEKKRLQSDKGPFGVGEKRKVPKEGSDSGRDEPGESSESSQSFRKAPSGLTLHLRLQRYAQRRPGRLATRLLQKMERATRFEGAMPLRGKPPGNEVKPSALSYYLAILTPALKDRWNIRTQRELRVLVEILDQMAIENGPGAAGIVAQRIKALEQSVLDNNTWKKAKFLELTAEEASLADKGEEQMMVKEAELEDRLKTRGSWGGHWDDGRTPFRGKDGKGTGKTKGKEKGKPKTPAQEDILSWALWRKGIDVSPKKHFATDQEVEVTVLRRMSRELSTSSVVPVNSGGRSKVWPDAEDRWKARAAHDFKYGPHEFGALPWWAHFVPVALAQFLTIFAMTVTSKGLVFLLGFCEPQLGNEIGLVWWPVIPVDDLCS